MYNYKLTIQYDGTRYRGWQVQGNTPQTIQGKLEAVLSRLAGEPFSVSSTATCLRILQSLPSLLPRSGSTPG